MAILFHFPNVLKQSFREDLRAIPWRNDPFEFSDWCEGRTGYPIIDAAMRQLLNTGWMHNRGQDDSRLIPSQAFDDRLAVGRTLVHAKLD